MAVSRINEAGLNINQYGNRNVVINGAMQVAQRGTSFTGLGADGESYNLDRFVTFASSTAGRATITQDADSPDGFANSLKIACTTADTSVAAGEIFFLQHRIEGQDLQRFAKGTNGAKEYTVSFYVKGNANATYVCELFDVDNNRHVAKTFSVTTGWTRVELTFPADTTGAFDDDNARSLDFTIWLHAGSTYTGGTLPSTWAAFSNANRAVGAGSIFDSTSRTFYMTGLQMEVGDTATDFEHRTFGDELARCQRYYQTSFRAGVAPNDSDTSAVYQTAVDYSGGYTVGHAFYQTNMRGLPTVVTYTSNPSSNAATNRVCYYNGSSWNNCTMGITNRTESGFALEANTGDTNTVLLQFNYTADAEL